MSVIQIIKFDWKENSEIGSTGWILRNCPDFYPSDGAGIAHDALEHFPDDTGTLAGELQAFGASLLIRGESGDYARFRSGNSWAEACDYNVQEICEIATRSDEYGSYEHRRMDIAPVTPPLEEHLEAQLTLLSQLACEPSNDRWEEWTVEQQVEYREHLAQAINWIRLGYRRALSRYNHASPDELLYLYRFIQTEVDRKFKHGDDYDVLNVRIDLKELDVRIYRTNPYYQH